MTYQIEFKKYYTFLLKDFMFFWFVFLIEDTLGPFVSLNSVDGW